MGISKKEWLILGGLVVAAAALYLFLLGPTAQEGKRLTAEAQRLTHQSQKIQQTLKAVPKGREGLKEARSHLEKIRARLLPSVSSLFAEISRPSKRLGVRIISFTPKGPDPTKHGQVSADLVLQGTYLELGQYLEELFDSRFILSADDLQLHAPNPGGSRLRMHLILKSWMKQGSSG